ncbi:MAG TPA: HAD family hydrolase, partial [Ottowia sp.]|nr:HAD family hydrolase [Ottowia sp.]
MHAELVLAAGQPWHPAKVEAEQTAPSPHHLQLLRAAALCNDACPSGDCDDKGHIVWQGDPTETALTAVAAQADLLKPELEEETPRVRELPFDSDRKRMTTFHRDGAVFEAFTKGAPESVLPCCTAHWSPEGRRPLDQAAVLAEAERLAAQGLRVMAFASRAWPQLPAEPDVEAIESELALIGLIGLIDPPREEAAAAVRDCISAGIRPVMITGDHPATALAIAQRLGIVANDAANVITGAELTELDDAALKARVLDVRVYARVDPAQKIRIVQALQSH